MQLQFTKICNNKSYNQLVRYFNSSLQDLSTDLIWKITRWLQGSKIDLESEEGIISMLIKLRIFKLVPISVQNILTIVSNVVSSKQDLRYHTIKDFCGQTFKVCCALDVIISQTLRYFLDVLNSILPLEEEIFFFIAMHRWIEINSRGIFRVL